MKALKDVKEFELVYLVPSKFGLYSITPLVLCPSSKFQIHPDYNDSHGKVSLSLSTGEKIISIFVSKKLFNDGEDGLRVLAFSHPDYSDCIVFAEEESAKQYILRNIASQEKLAIDDIDKCKKLIREKRKLLVDLKKKRKEFSL